MIKESIVYEIHKDTESFIVLESGRPDHYLLVHEDSSDGYKEDCRYITTKELHKLQDAHPEVPNTRSVEKSVAEKLTSTYEGLTYDFDEHTFSYKGQELQVKYNPSLVKDLMKYHTIDAEEEVIQVLTGLIPTEMKNIDKELDD